MKGAEMRLIDYMSGSKKKFIIPVYQRNYDWKIENCHQLYDDLVEVIRQNRRSHFFGSIVSVYQPSGRNMEYLIIDGQQRLTTISLLLLAMCKLLREGKVKSEEVSLDQDIFEYLVYGGYSTESRMKLKPVKNDNEALRRLFSDNAELVPDSNLTVNYHYFYERIQKEEITVDDLLDAVSRLEIIHIELNNDDDPQLIFESLNSTGLALTEGDKIRNYILMALPAQKQEEYYESYWNPIEVFTKYDVSAFVRDYLSVKQQRIPAQYKIYATFKEYVKREKVEAKELLVDLLSYAKRYGFLLSGGTGNKILDGCIARLNRLGATITRPFFLEVLRLHDEGRLSLENVAEVFQVTESYMFRRTVCAIPTNALNKIFLALHREIVRYDGTDADYLEKFKHALLRKRENGRFPDDVEFSKAFAERQVYQMAAKNKIYLMERLENEGTAEDKDVYRHIEEGEYSIEHIMPQTMTPAWEKELGEGATEIHERWLHRVANLTLTAYNSRYSNSSFAEKKSMQHGFLESGIRMNQRIAQKVKWGEYELEERSVALTQEALAIWALPHTKYEPHQKEVDWYTLADELDMTGRKVAKFQFMGVEESVKNWAVMFQRVSQLLYELDETILLKLAAGDGKHLGGYFSMNATEPSRYLPVAGGVYAYVGTSTKAKLYALGLLFERYGIDSEELSFTLWANREEENISE